MLLRNIIECKFASGQDMVSCVKENQGGTALFSARCSLNSRQSCLYHTLRNMKDFLLTLSIVIIPYKIYIDSLKEKGIFVFNHSS